MNARQRRGLRRLAARLLKKVGRDDILVNDYVALDLAGFARQCLWERRGGQVFQPGSMKSKAGETTRNAAGYLKAAKARQRRYLDGRASVLE